MPVSLIFSSITADNSSSFTSALSATANVLVIGEKAALSAENALSLLGLPEGFAAPIADGETITAYIGGKAITVASFAEKQSRTTGVIRSDSITDVVSKNGKGDKDLSIVVFLKNQDQALAASLAIARAYPLYENRKKASAERNVCVHFLLAEAPKSITSTITTKITTTKGSSTTESVSTVTSTKTSSSKTVTTAELQTAADAVRECAKLVDTPPNELNPTTYVELVQKLHAEKLAAFGVELTVIQGAELRDRGFGGIWNVGKASENLPALIHLSHVPAGAVKTVAWVGKGLTFDTGGLDIKVGGGMVGMKTDMGGSAGIFQGFVATVLNGINTNFALHAILCVAENSVDTRSFRPDDIITAYSGKTVEVTDTDAEGRLCLMDGVAYASKDLNADVILDMATLTGAQASATGYKHAGLVVNSEEFEAALVAAGRVSGDLCHPMLYCPEFLAADKTFPSVVADMVNYPKSATNNAGSASAGFFVGAHLVPADDFKEDGSRWWAHVDMAFPSTVGGRGSGYGVGLLHEISRTLNAKFAAKREE
ncbi:putative aminopeptidase npepl1 [Rhizoclosmatium sp. JEL0117]|nr:putative aminopeptidase npepl1 [Rhizoclosmatium sp. JEL0117]